MRPVNSAIEETAKQNSDRIDKKKEYLALYVVPACRKYIYTCTYTYTYTDTYTDTYIIDGAGVPRTGGEDRCTHTHTHTHKHTHTHTIHIYIGGACVPRTGG